MAAATASTAALNCEDRTISVEAPSLVRCSRSDGAVESAASPLQVQTRFQNVPASAQQHEYPHVNIRPQISPEQGKLLMVSISAVLFRFGDRVRKVVRETDDVLNTEENVEAMRNEANIYLILGHSPHIPKCLTIGPSKDYVELEFYPDGTLKQYVNQHQPLSLHTKRKYASQMIKSLAFIHDNGVVHSDLRLEQWLLDPNLDARLSDFNVSGYSSNNKLGLEGSRAVGIEWESHAMPREWYVDSTVQSDLFALASSLYELEKNERPFSTLTDEEIESSYKAGKFPTVEECLLEGIILGCWTKKFVSAHEVMEYGEQFCGL